MHNTHSYLIIGLVAVGAMLLLSGSAGGLVFLLWPLACIGMMFFMMRSMGGMGRGDHRHDDEHDSSTGRRR